MATPARIPESVQRQSRDAEASWPCLMLGATVIHEDPAHGAPRAMSIARICGAVEVADLERATPRGNLARMHRDDAMLARMFVVAVALLGLASCRVARMALPTSGGAWIASFAVTLALYVVVSVSVVLSVLRLFTPTIVLSTVCAIALFGLTVSARSRPSPGPARSGSFQREHLPLVIVAFGFLPHWLRAMAAPPRAWDALTYHLPRVANWLADGGFVPHIAPDAARYYEFFSPGGELVFAFSFLAGHGDTLLFLVYALTTGVVVLATYVLARSLDASPLDASFAAALVGTMPCVIQSSASAYVDNQTLATTLLALAFMVRALRSKDVEASIVASMLALGIAASTKISTVPFAVACAVVLVITGTRLRCRRPILIAAGCLALLPAAAFMSYSWQHTGSLTYPFELRLGTHELSAGNALLRRTLEGALDFGDVAPISTPEFVAQLFAGSSQAGWPHLNLGLGAVVALTLGTVAAMRAEGIPRVVRIVLTVAALIPVVALFAPNVATLRGLWAPVSGRFVASTVAVAACLAAAHATTASRVGLGAAVLLALPTLAPVGVSFGDVQRGGATMALASAWVFAAAASAVMASRRLSAARAAFAILVLGATPTAFSTLERLRAEVRAGYYLALARGESFEMHRVPVGNQSRLWRTLDGPTHERIAFSVGFEAPGHFGFTYPLYGSRLQNTVTYVPATLRGDVVDSPLDGEQSAPLDADIYADRLVAERVSALVFIRPFAPEVELVRAHPSRFALRASSRYRDYLVYRPLPRDVIR